MNDETQPFAVRFAAARVALPFCHPRVAAVHVAKDANRRTHEEWVRLLSNRLGDEQ